MVDRLEAGSTRIQRIEVFGYDLTYAHGDYVMSEGRVVNQIPSTVVRMVVADGTSGFGETCPLGSTYLPAFAAGARAALEVLAPSLIGADAANLADVRRRMDGALRGHEYAKSALDTACWDVIGRCSGLPVWALLGGRAQELLPLYVAVPLGDPDDMRRFVERERERGVRRFQLKVGARPEEDFERVAEVLEATGPEDGVIADANGGWRLQQAIEAARLMEPLHRLRLEQPCATFEESLAVRQLTTLPMVLDEVIVDLGALHRAMTHMAMDHINLKIGRVGGLTRARLMRDAAVELGLVLTIEDSWGGDIVTATVSHLAAAVPAQQLFAVSFMNDWTVESVAQDAPRMSNGFGPVPDGPGLGITVDIDAFGPALLAVGE